MLPHKPIRRLDLSPNVEPGLTPLDATPDRRPLVGGDLPPGEYSVDRRPDASRRHWKVVTGAGVVELAPIDKSTIAVEDERIGRTDRREGAGHVLGLVVEIRKRPAVATGLGNHLIGSVLRIADHVIAGDTDHRDALIGEVPTERGEPGSDVLDVWAVVTDKRDDKRRTGELVEADRGAGGRLEQPERRRNGAKGEHGGLDGHVSQGSPTPLAFLDPR